MIIQLPKLIRIILWTINSKLIKRKIIQIILMITILTIIIHKINNNNNNNRLIIILINKMKQKTSKISSNTIIMLKVLKGSKIKRE
jgi:hypothetical protein